MKKKLFAFTPLDNCAASASAFSGNVIKNQLLLLKNIDKSPAKQLLVLLSSLSNRAKPQQCVCLLFVFHSF
jgi:hypothetical protein